MSRYQFEELKIAFRKGETFKDAFVTCDIPLTALEDAKRAWKFWCVECAVGSYRWGA
jgi:hypothetical protein